MRSAPADGRGALVLGRLSALWLMSGIVIRAATPADIAAITRIYAHAVRFGTASFEIEPPDAAAMARRQRALIEGGYPYLVAEGDGAIAGYPYARPYRSRPAYPFSAH